MKKLQKIEVTIQEIRMATRPNVYVNKKKYKRKTKHKNNHLKPNQDETN
jgi:hypothetical protein